MSRCLTESLRSTSCWSRRPESAASRSRRPPPSRVMISAASAASQRPRGRNLPPASSSMMERRSCDLATDSLRCRSHNCGRVADGEMGRMRKERSETKARRDSELIPLCKGFGRWMCGHSSKPFMRLAIEIQLLQPHMGTSLYHSQLAP